MSLPLPILNLRQGGGGFGFAGDAAYAWDFITGQAKWAGVVKGDLSNTPGWSFTRASTGYAQTQAGVLVPFASGALRRTDKGVLIEATRTNLLTRSQEFSHSDWGQTAVTVTGGQNDPAGGSTAYSITESSSGSLIRRASSTTVVSATTYTAYFIAKRGNFDWLRVMVGDGAAATNVARVWFNLNTGAVGSNDSAGTGYGFVSKTMQAIGSGWYICAVTFTAPTTTFFLWALSASADASTTRADVGGGAGIGSLFYLWHAQLEAGTFHTSPIVTTTASATRAADVLSVGSVTGLDYPLSLYAEFERVVDTGGNEIFLHVDAGSTANRALISLNNSDFARFQVIAASVAEADITRTGAVALATVSKITGRAALNDARIYRDGLQGSQDTSVALPSTPTAIRFGGDSSASGAPFGYLRRAAIYNTAKSDADLQAMTT